MKKVISLGLLLCAGIAMSQEKMTQVPPVELKDLSFREGNWKGDFMMKSGTTESKTTATMETKSKLGGRYLVSENVMVTDGMTHYGTMIFTFDTARKKWIGWWFDSMTPMPVEVEGDWTNNTLTLMSKSSTSSSVPPMRVTYRKSANDKLEVMIESLENGTWSTAIRGTLTKDM